MKRVFNFSAGPAVLPLDVLMEAQAELLNYEDTGMSVMEMSHRSAPFEKILNDAYSTVKLDDNPVLFIYKFKDVE